MKHPNLPNFCSVHDGPLAVQVMVAILKDMGINDFEPRVINQMLEFSYRCSSLTQNKSSLILKPRYVTGILEDARVYSSHAKKKTLDTEDVKLAVQLTAEQVLFKTLPLNRI